MDESNRPVTKVKPARARGLARPIVSRKGAMVSIEVTPRSKGPSPRPWEQTGSIDVEQLVAWAFGVQKADRFAAVGLHAIEAGIDGVSFGARSGDGCGVLDDMENLGCRVDRSRGIVQDCVHPAAAAVAALACEIRDGEMVRHFGRLGVRPDGWREPKSWWRPVVWKRYPVEAQSERVGQGARIANVTRVMPTITREELSRRREAYGRWWEALDQLAWKLSLRALGFAVRSPAAPREPWLEPELPLEPSR
jgi:hypothetical protein